MNSTFGLCPCACRYRVPFPFHVNEPYIVETVRSVILAGTEKSMICLFADSRSTPKSICTCSFVPLKQIKFVMERPAFLANACRTPTQYMNPARVDIGRGRPSFEVIHIEVIYRPGVWKAAQEHRVAWHRSAAGSRLYKKAGDK
jgi:hypothetical protein